MPVPDARPFSRFPVLSTRQEAFCRWPAAPRQASLWRRPMTIH